MCRRIGEDSDIWNIEQQTDRRTDRQTRDTAGDIGDEFSSKASIRRI